MNIEQLKEGIKQKIKIGIAAKNWTSSEFAEGMQVHPSVVTRWLSGTHNFELNTIWKIEEVLGIQILNLPLEINHAMNELRKPLDFGDYCTIEQHRFNGPNEHYLHKVIGTGKSNCWVEVPVKGSIIHTFHDYMDDVVACICAGVSEIEVFKYRVVDIKQISSIRELQLELEKLKAK